MANSLVLIQKLVLGDVLDRYQLAHAVFVLDGAEADQPQLEEYADELRAANTVLVSKLDLISAETASALQDALIDIGVKNVLRVDNGVAERDFLSESSRILEFVADYASEFRAHQDNVNYTVIEIEKPISPPAQLEQSWPQLQDEFGLHRLKGDFQDDSSQVWHVEATPSQIRLIEGRPDARMRIVAIGSKARLLTLERLMEVVGGA